MGVYNNNKDGTRSTIANTIQVVDAPIEQFVSRGEFNAVVPSDTSADNKLVNDNTVNTKLNDIWKVQGKLGAKNLLPYPYSQQSQTTNGIAYTVDDKGRISTSGTSTGVTNFQLNNNLILDEGSYIITDGCVDKTKQYIVVWYKHGNTIDTLATTKYVTSATFSITQEQAAAIKNGESYVVVRLMGDNSNMVWDNLIFYPMIRYTGDTDNTWQPYVPTNYQLYYNDTEIKQDIADIWKVQGELGAKNLLVYPYQKLSGESKGVTMTVNSNGSVRLNGTALDGDAQNIIYDLNADNPLILKEGTYVFSVKGLDNSTMYADLLIRDSLNSWQTIINRSAISLSPFVITQQIAEKLATREYRIQIKFCVRRNQTVDNIIYPIIRYASDTDNTWQPYVKTNYDLTQNQNFLTQNQNFLTQNQNFLMNHIYISVTNKIEQSGLVKDNVNGVLTSQKGIIKKEFIHNKTYYLEFDKTLYEALETPNYGTLNTTWDYSPNSIKNVYNNKVQLGLKTHVDILDSDSNINGLSIPFNFYWNNRSNWGAGFPKILGNTIIGKDTIIPISNERTDKLLDNLLPSYFSECFIVLELGSVFNNSIVNSANARRIKIYVELVTIPVEQDLSNSPITDIVCWGDSLTAMGGWTQKLQELSGIPVYNGGTGGEDSKCIMARQGGDVMIVDGITIPTTTTAVTIASRATDTGISTELGNKVTPLFQTSAHVNPVTIGDITGTLAWTGSDYTDQNGTWTFTRATIGEEIIIDRPTAIRTNFDNIHNGKNELMIIYMGANGGWTDVANLIHQHKLMIDHFKGKEYVVLGLSSGTAASRADYEAAMKEAFGRRFISLREYLAHPIYENGEIVSCYGLADQGLTPSTKEYAGVTYNSLDEIATGTVPHQLLIDGIHYTEGTREVIGKMLYKKIKELNIL